MIGRKKQVKKTLNWLVYGEKPTGIVNSQVLDLASILQKDINIVSTVWVLSPLSAYSQYRKEYRQLNLGVKVVVLPMLPFQGKNWLWKHNSLLLLFAGAIKRKNSIWIARGPKAGCMIRILKKYNKSIHFIYQSRGSIHDEAREFSSDSAGQLAVEEEKNSLLTADKVLVVTNQLVERHQEIYGFDISNKTVVCPTIILSHRIPSAPRKADSNSKNLSDCFVYISGGQGWQSEKLLVDFLTIAKRDWKKSFSLRYLGNPPSFAIQQEILNICKVKFGRVPPDEVMNEIQGASFGILLRDDTFTNKVSSPTKFAEYCAAGLIPVICGVPFFENLLVEHKAPCIFFNQKDRNLLSLNLDLNRIPDAKTRIQEFTKEHLSEKSQFYFNFQQLMDTCVYPQRTTQYK